MSTSIWSTFIINIGINSFLSFLTLELLIVLGLAALRIRSARLRMCCLLIPFIKLIADLGAYQFSSWALLQEMNPLEFPEGTRFLSAGLFFQTPPLEPHLCYISCHLEEGQTFSLADLLCLTIGPTWTLISATMLLITTAVSLTLGIRHFFSSRSWIKELETKAIRYTDILNHSHLRGAIADRKISIYLTDRSHSPFITGHRHPKLFIPHTLFTALSDKEVEALIAHEVAHLIHGDLIINTLLYWISRLFWWVPTRFFKKQLDLAQEYACDQWAISKTSSIDLAEALYKASIHLKPSHIEFPQPSAASHCVLERFREVLKPMKTESPLWRLLKTALLIGWIVPLTLSKLWTF